MLAFRRHVNGTKGRKKRDSIYNLGAAKAQPSFLSRRSLSLGILKRSSSHARIQSSEAPPNSLSEYRQDQRNGLVSRIPDYISRSSLAPLSLSRTRAQEPIDPNSPEIFKSGEFLTPSAKSAVRKFVIRESLDSRKVGFLKLHLRPVSFSPFAQNYSLDSSLRGANDRVVARRQTVTKEGIEVTIENPSMPECVRVWAA